jgi:hypothetical protein
LAFAAFQTDVTGRQWTDVLCCWHNDWV